MSDLISREALKEHKFVGNKYMQIGGRTNGKTLENINKAYQQGWNDAIDAIIDDATPVDTSEREAEAYRKGYVDGMIRISEISNDTLEKVLRGGA